jgi:acyl-CoA reductase-like NAD-dependent aldehyde dehydrogenase
LDAYVFSKDEMTVQQMSTMLQVGTLHVNDLPLYCDDYLPVTGRKRSSKVFKGVSKEALRKFTKSKAFDIHRL